MSVSKPDILVIGGGPAGSTFGNLAVQQGWDVALLEKDEHPRFHIGESLLPMTMPIVERLGLWQDLERIGVRKNGADFTTFRRGAYHHTYPFSRALGDSPDHAFQVRRSEFDEMLYEKCRDVGVDVRDRNTVTKVEELGGGKHRVTSVDANGVESVWEPKFLVDASGRDTFLSGANGWKQRNPQHASAAVFGHFRGVRRRADENEGDISIYWFEHGWVWMIPLRDDVMSVGAVCDPDYIKSRRESLDEFLLKTVNRMVGTRSRMRDAVQDRPAQATGNYSYLSSRMMGPGYLMIGDAFAFIDPVFSSGVHLAMSSAARGIAVAGAWLEGDARKYRKACRDYEQETKRGIDTFAWFIYRFRSPTMSWLFSNPRNPLRLVEGVVSMLAGDVFTNRSVRRRLLVFKAVYAIASVLLRARVISESSGSRPRSTRNMREA
ncbi:MAG: hydroxylase [Woeseiaceae bacterium]|nr:hydroxylase [Woeseiaceae bacterium]NIP20853.1 hydroxylase [Woeseiaceae bacterium]NIS89646.1 hydroxylase [Woeseiaceae bacterium]